MVERYRPRAERAHPPRYVRQSMVMDDYLKRWISIHATRSHWRVAHWLDLDDLIQDGYMLWRVVTTRYLAVTERAHMVALFQTTFIRHVHALANRRTHSISEAPLTGLERDDEEADDPVALSDGGDGARQIELAAMLATAPEPIRKLLDYLRHGDLKALRMPDRYGHHETLAHRLARLTGQVEPDGTIPNFRQMLKDCLK